LASVEKDILLELDDAELVARFASKSDRRMMLDSLACHATELSLVLSAAVDACEVCNEHSVIPRVSSLPDALCMCYRLSLTYFCISVRISNNMGN